MLRQVSGFAGSVHHLPLPYVPAHARDELRQLFGFLWIGRRRHDEGELQQVQLTTLIGRHLDAVEPGAFLGELGDGSDRFLIRPRFQRFRIDGDIGLRHPAGLTVRHPQALQRLIDSREKQRGFGGRRFARGRSRRARAAGDRPNQADHQRES